MVIFWDAALLNEEPDHSCGKENTQDKQTILDLVEALMARNIKITELDVNSSIYTRIEHAVANKLVERQDILDILKRLDSQYTFDKMSGIVEDIMNLPNAGKRVL